MKTSTSYIQSGFHNCISTVTISSNTTRPFSLLLSGGVDSSSDSAARYLTGRSSFPPKNWNKHYTLLFLGEVGIFQSFSHTFSDALYLTKDLQHFYMHCRFNFCEMHLKQE